MTNKIINIINKTNDSIAYHVVQEHSFGNIKSYMKPLYTTYFEFLNSHFNTNINVKLVLLKARLNSNQVAHVTFNSNVIKLHNVGYKLQLKYIAHEFTHLVQMNTNRLVLRDNKMYFDSIEIDISKYNNITSKLDAYKLPFEREAYDNEDLLLKNFIKSKYFDSVYNNNPTLDYILDNIEFA